MPADIYRTVLPLYLVEYPNTTPYFGQLLLKFRVRLFILQCDSSGSGVSAHIRMQIQIQIVYVCKCKVKPFRVYRKLVKRSRVHSYSPSMDVCVCACDCVRWAHAFDYYLSTASRAFRFSIHFDCRSINNCYIYFKSLPTCTKSVPPSNILSAYNQQRTNNRLDWKFRMAVPPPGDLLLRAYNCDSLTHKYVCRTDNIRLAFAHSLSRSK